MEMYSKGLRLSGSTEYIQALIGFTNMISVHKTMQFLRDTMLGKFIPGLEFMTAEDWDKAMCSEVLVVEHVDHLIPATITWEEMNKQAASYVSNKSVTGKLKNFNGNELFVKALQAAGVLQKDLDEHPLITYLDLFRQSSDQALTEIGYVITSTVYSRDRLPQLPPQYELNIDGLRVTINAERPLAISELRKVANKIRIEYGQQRTKAERLKQIEELIQTTAIEHPVASVRRRLRRVPIGDEKPTWLRVVSALYGIMLDFSYGATKDELESHFAELKRREPAFRRYRLGELTHDLERLSLIKFIRRGYVSDNGRLKYEKFYYPTRIPEKGVPLV